MHELEGQLSAAASLAYQEAAGLPAPEQARALFASVASEVWGNGTRRHEPSSCTEGILSSWTTA